MKKALICGVSGQDGSYLANFLLKKDYEVFGTSRDALGSSFTNLKKLGIFNQINYLSMYPEDFRSLFITISKVNPDEVYYLAGQSSVGLSFEQPAETIQSATIGTLNLLEACKLYNPDIRIYHAGSSECFGDTAGKPANENTPFSPRSPYGVAKSSAFWLVANYREAYDLYACTGILFNHESPLRPSRFVTRKIVDSAIRIAAGSDEKLVLGCVDIYRDWGWAPEYVEAMWLMLQQELPDDFVIATGHSSSLKNFVKLAFDFFDLDYRNYLKSSDDFIRPSELLVSRADPQKAHTHLNWHAKIKLDSAVFNMINGIIN